MFFTVLFYFLAKQSSQEAILESEFLTVFLQTTKKNVEHWMFSIFPLFITRDLSNEQLCAY